MNFCWLTGENRPRGHRFFLSHPSRYYTVCSEVDWLEDSCSVASGLHSIQDLALRPYTDVKTCSILVKRIQCSGLVFQYWKRPTKRRCWLVTLVSQSVVFVKVIERWNRKRAYLRGWCIFVNGYRTSFHVMYVFISFTRGIWFSKIIVFQISLKRSVG